MSEKNYREIIFQSKLSEVEIIRIYTLDYEYRKFALKTVKDTRMAHNEINILSKISHPHIIKLEYEYVKSQQLMMPYIRLTFLDLIVHESIHPNYIHIYFRQIASAVKYLHDNKIAHCDLKLQNFLIKRSHCYIIDFGISRFFTDDERTCTISGSLPYMSPEMTRSMPYHPTKQDIWSLAVCIFSCATTCFPIKHTTPEQFRMNIMNDIYYPDTIEPLLKDLLQHMFMKNPAKRCDINTVLAHPWFTK
jgi:serine/threonine protein kinase